MLAISLLNKKRNFESDSIWSTWIYKFSLRPGQNLECTGMQMCVRIASSFVMIAYIYISQHVVDKL
jgi:hypothetical protein